MRSISKKRLPTIWRCTEGGAAIPYKQEEGKCEAFLKMPSDDMPAESLGAAGDTYYSRRVRYVSSLGQTF